MLFGGTMHSIGVIIYNKTGQLFFVLSVDRHILGFHVEMTSNLRDTSPLIGI